MGRLKTSSRGLPLLVIMSTLWILIVSMHCTEMPDIPPRFAYAGYRADLVFIEDFGADLTEWAIEGKGEAAITPDSQLTVSVTDEEHGMVIWMRQDAPETFQLEYEVEIPETPGLNTVMICAHGTQEKDILKTSSARTGKFSEYSQGDVRSYQISYHCYSPNGGHDPGSKIRKNPGHILLSRIIPDPCIENRRYLVDVFKIGNRILFFVDGTPVHDIRDRGGFGPTYRSGKIGFWVHGAVGKFKTTFDHIKVYRLIPE